MYRWFFVIKEDIGTKKQLKSKKIWIFYCGVKYFVLICSSIRFANGVFGFCNMFLQICT